MMGASGADFSSALAARAAEIETALERWLPRAVGAEARLAEAMRYAALGGGKRMRAFLALEAASLLQARPEIAVRAAAAAECVHAYSLIHDDLPCMDDDDLRRGRPTTHIAFDEATAVLAGDALQALAFELVAGAETAPEVRAGLALELARAVGVAGMAGGQMIDIAAERSGEAMGLAEIERLQRLKTGALIRFAAVSGAVIAGADPAPFERYAAALGLVFQIRDDLLDAEGDEAAAGKRLGKDAARGKATFVAALGVDGARARAVDLVGEAKAALSIFGRRADMLAAAAEFALDRDR